VCASVCICVCMCVRVHVRVYVHVCVCGEKKMLERRARGMSKRCWLQGW